MSNLRIALAVGLVGCAVGTAPSSSEEPEACEPAVTEHHDVGQACMLSDDDGALTLLVAIVAYGGCASATDVGCAATLDGDRIDVTAWATVEERCGEACPLSLEMADAVCELPELGPGPFTLTYAGEETPFAIPVASGSTCVGEPPVTL